MKTITTTATAEKAHGKSLDSPLSFDVVYDAYETYAEVVAANDLPKEKEVLAFRNAQRLARATTASRNAALEAAGIVKPTVENDPQLRLRETAKLFVANGESPEVARISASTALGIAWED